MPPEGPKCGKEAYLGYSGRHQVYLNFQPFPPLSLPVATPGKASTAAAAKIMCSIAFSFTLIQFFNKLIFTKRQFLKIVTTLVYIYALLSPFFCSLLLWQKPILHSSISIIIVIIIVINLAILLYVNKM
jgi:hypothetical protein